MKNAKAGDRLLNSNIDVYTIDSLISHPHNPRRNLGDLSELAESIKVHGIMQPLLVTPYNCVETDKTKWEDDYYTFVVIAGHRRLAAARLAGLETVPCVVAELDEREQLGVMLAENMQRADLTIPEQVEGIQLMLDLGETVQTVAEITGLSETTVRRRAKLSEYDKDKLAQAMERGARIEDYAELEKVKDPEIRESILDDIGTHNFEWRVKRAINLQEAKERLPALEAKLKAIAKPLKASENMYNPKYIKVKSFTYNNDEGYAYPTDADKRKYYYKIEECDTYLLTDAPKTMAKRPALSDEEKALKARLAALEELSERAKAARADWVKGYAPKKADAPKILRFLCLGAALGNTGRAADIVALSGLTDVDVEGFYLGCLMAEYIGETISYEKLAVLTAVASFEHDYRAAFHYPQTGKHYGDKSVLPTLYDELDSLGYRASDEELALLKGTHELYTREVSK